MPLNCGGGAGGAVGGVNFREDTVGCELCGEAVGGVNFGEEAVGDIPLYINQITAGLPITAHWETHL